MVCVCVMFFVLSSYKQSLQVSLLSIDQEIIFVKWKKYILYGMESAVSFIEFERSRLFTTCSIIISKLHIMINVEEG